MMIFQTIRKYATLIKWGGIILLVMGILYSVYDYSQSKERLDRMEDENAELVDDMETLQQNIKEQKENLTQIRNNYNQIELQYSNQLEQINELRELTSEYIIANNPEVQSEINSKFDTIQSSLECITGNKSKCLEQ